VTVIPVSPRVWQAAFDLYRSRRDKDWSFIDCTSILLCQSRRINRIFTHDHHFKQAGFDTLLR
jgi:predicted nucleic acid-binding protein